MGNYEVYDNFYIILFYITVAVLQQVSLYIKKQYPVKTLRERQHQPLGNCMLSQRKDQWDALLLNLSLSWLPIRTLVPYREHKHPIWSIYMLKWISLNHNSNKQCMHKLIKRRWVRLLYTLCIYFLSWFLFSLLFLLSL